MKGETISEFNFSPKIITKFCNATELLYLIRLCQPELSSLRNSLNEFSMDLELRVQLRINTKYKSFMHGGREQSQQYISYFLELNTMIK